MKISLFILFFTPLSIFAQNYTRVEEKPAVFIEIDGRRHYVNEKYEVIATSEQSENYETHKNIDGVIFHYKIVKKDTVTLSVRVKKMPQYEYEFKPMLESLFHNLKCPTTMQELEYVTGMWASKCKYLNEYDKAFDCLLTSTNDFIRRGYRF